MKDLVYRAEAVSDIRAAYAWYERQRPRLGDEFLGELRRAEQSIHASPEAFRIVYRNSHRYLMHRFPYQVLYEVVDEVIVVIGCFHVRRTPQVLRERADD